MSAEKAEAKALRLMILGTISELPKPDAKAVHAIAEEIRASIAKGDTQENGIGTLAFALVGAELQESAS